MGILDGQVALVTGAGRGFGRAIAERFASEGANVALAARSKDQLDEVAAAIRADGGEAIAVPCDITSPAAIGDAISTVEDHFGSVGLLVS
ncbi:MAG TPA: SDR family NAD(P)-dependent oxidoreductase, partial [Alteraurantiacibacter sp.]